MTTSPYASQQRKRRGFNSFLTADKATKLTSVAAWTTNIP